MIPIQLDLTQINGNAFAILPAFRKAAKSQGRSQAEIDLVLADARSGDYDHLLATIMRYTDANQ